MFNKNPSIILKIFYSIFIFAVMLAPFQFADAQDIKIDFPDPLGGANLQTLISKFLQFIVQIGTMVAVFFVIYAGFLFVTASGDETKLTTAKSTLMWTLIGAVILIGAQALSEVICNTATDLGAKTKC